jgi:hypothetical protein
MRACTVYTSRAATTTWASRVSSPAGRTRPVPSRTCSDRQPIHPGGRVLVPCNPSTSRRPSSSLVWPCARAVSGFDREDRIGGARAHSRPAVGIIDRRNPGRRPCCARRARHPEGSSRWWSERRTTAWAWRCCNSNPAVRVRCPWQWVQWSARACINEKSSAGPPQHGAHGRRSGIIVHRQPLMPRQSSPPPSFVLGRRSTARPYREPGGGIVLSLGSAILAVLRAA